MTTSNTTSKNDLRVMFATGYIVNTNECHVKYKYLEKIKYEFCIPLGRNIFETEEKALRIYDKLAKKIIDDKIWFIFKKQLFTDCNIGSYGLDIVADDIDKNVLLSKMATIVKLD